MGKNCLAWLLAACTCLAADAASAETFERITPAQAGYDADRLEQLRLLLSERGSEAMLLLKDGKVFFEYGDIDAKRLVHSMRKPLLSALIGTELGRGCLDLDKTLADYGIDERPPGLSEAEKSATLRQVLQSRSGVYHPATAETEDMAAARPARGSHAPGTHYYYNNWDFNVAGAIFEKCAGQGVHEAFAERIAAPLGMRDFTGRIVSLPDVAALPVWADGFRQLEPDVSRYRAYHFRLSARDLALFGQLYLQRGQWQGRSLVPADWVDESTAPASVTNADYGLAYGMLWSSLVPGPDQKRPSFYHAGVGVHMLGVYPDLDLVMVHRVNTEQPYSFNGGDLYAVIRAMHGARND
ncbi:serine hydrolase [Arenimonas soli]|uniref:Serine hydrolase n=1 Tax=Arenimonas soli TaxID=2269504 RepID=A0ABQ1HG77_9GAMM|nr:serine hydrolase [Arenimonas soli]GGA73863.1 serine hydrolase [Arenimonas soli]